MSEHPPRIMSNWEVCLLASSQPCTWKLLSTVYTRHNQGKNTKTFAIMGAPLGFAVHNILLGTFQQWGMLEA